jgi:hypothetical protein
MYPRTLGVLLLLFLLIGCGSNNSNNANGSHAGQNSTNLPSEVTNALASSTSTLTQPLQDSIQYMYNEEGLAYDIYLSLYQIYPLQQLQNIALNSESKHQEAVNQLAIKYALNLVPSSAGIYEVEAIDELYDTLYQKGVDSEQDALEVGCMVEVVDIDDLNTFISQAQASNAPDVVAIFDYLRKGSYKHYWEFDSALKSRGVSEGCCGVESYGDHQFCHPEYPNT